MLIEMHCHTSEHSACSHVAAVDLVRRAFEKGLQGIVLTDHHYCWPPNALTALKTRAEVPKFFLVGSGQEVSTSDFGDVLVYGADRPIPPRTPVTAIRREYPQAALVWAHPYRDEREPAADLLLDAQLDAVEIFNSNHTYCENARGLRDWHRYRFTAIAGTDTHAVGYTGTFPTLFDHPVASIVELAEEVRQGRCRPFFREFPREGRNIQVTELTLGADPAQPEKIIIKELEPTKWPSAERAVHVQEKLVRLGFGSGPFRVPHPLSVDAASRTLVEEGIRGRNLFDTLVAAEPRTARHALRLTAKWLARLHGCPPITPPGEFPGTERERLGRFLAAFSQVDHRFTRRAQEILDRILEIELARFRGHPERLVQSHGDFNPKNLLFGHDDPDDPATAFVAGIDFDEALCLPPAFDVGTFLAQFRSQFFDHREVLRKVSEATFLNAYLGAANDPGPGFRAEVELFRARANMSIAYYLIKVGLGESESLWRVLVEADQSLAGLGMHGF
jgi:predicted metal-dependent phosphoesterase TrpH